MDNDRAIELLTEIRDVQQRLLESHRQALRNQEEAIRAQREALARGRRLQAALGLVIAVVLVMVVWLLMYVVRHYS